MGNGTFLWKTRQELEFILSIYFNQKVFKTPRTKMGIFRDLGWNVDKRYWATAPIFSRLVLAGVLVPSGISKPQFYHLDNKKLNNTMWEDPVISKVAETEWIVEKIFK